MLISIYSCLCENRQLRRNDRKKLERRCGKKSEISSFVIALGNSSEFLEFIGVTFKISYLCLPGCFVKSQREPFCISPLCFEVSMMIARFHCGGWNHPCYYPFPHFWMIHRTMLTRANKIYLPLKCSKEVHYHGNDTEFIFYFFKKIYWTIFVFNYEIPK